MTLREGDEVIEVNNATDEADLLVVTENGYGKRTPIRDYRQTGPWWARREDRSADRGAWAARRRTSGA